MSDVYSSVVATGNLSNSYLGREMEASLKRVEEREETENLFILQVSSLSAVPSEIPPQQSKSVPQFSSVAQSCPTLCNPMNRSTPGLPVHHQLPEFTQTQVHRVGDAIQPSHPLSSPSPPAPNPSQHQSLFQ